MANISKTSANIAEKKIIKYIAKDLVIINICRTVFAITAIILLLMGTVFSKSDSPETAMELGAVKTEKNSYAYFDAAEVSDIVYHDKDDKDRVYTSVDDRKGAAYIIKLSDGEYTSLKAKVRSSEGEPVRIYGAVSGIPNIPKIELASAYSMSSDEFKAYFGETCLEVGSTPSGNIASIYRSIAALFGMFWFVMTYGGTGYQISDARRSIKKLKKLGELEKAAAELEAAQANGASTGMSGYPVNYIATDNYLFGKETGSALAYDDILMVYPKSKAGIKTSSKYCIAMTADKKKHYAALIGVYDANAEAQEIAAIIRHHNPVVLYGNTFENKRQYSALCRQANGRKS